MPVTSADIVNQALLMIGGNQPPVTGNAPNFDDSTAGKAAAKLYTPCVQTVGRQWGWDMARNTFTLVLSGNAAPDPPGGTEYLYPPFAIQIWQVVPGAGLDPNNPIPVNWTVYNTLVNNVQTKVLQTAAASPKAVLNSNPTESVWDPGFREAVVRLLASELAIAIAGRPDSSESLIQSGSAFETIAEGRPD